MCDVVVSDVNECARPGHCTQFCHNLEGSFKCSCRPGFMLDPLDHVTCRAISTSAYSCRCESRFLLAVNVSECIAAVLCILVENQMEEKRRIYNYSASNNSCTVLKYCKQS